MSQGTVLVSDTKSEQQTEVSLGAELSESEWHKQFLKELNSIDGPEIESPPVLDQKVQKPDDQTEYMGDPEWAEIIAEDALPLQERYSQEFAKYKQLFYDFCRKSPYHIKRSYKTGFVAPRQKRRKDGATYSPYCYEDILTRHLDPERWLLSHPDEFPNDQPDNFWLGLRFGKKTKLGCIDFDNKQNVIGFYNTCMVGSDPARPLSVLTLEHIQNIKRLYDTFPNRIWCVSSATLGLHLWEKLPSLLNHRQVEIRYRPKLRTIGLPNVEVYPSPQLSHQVLRRPFGEDYYTITDDGLLSDWVEQLDHFENPGVPTFTSIVSCLIELATREWRRYQQLNGLFLTKTGVNSVDLDGKPHLQTYVYDDMAIPTEFLRELARVKKWLDAGCPEQVQDTSPCSDNTCINKENLPNNIPASNNESKNVAKGKWVESCVDWATDGLPGEDSLFQVINALARWFYFVELFEVQANHRIEKTTELLQHFALTKHNGYITTLNNGLIDEVENRVRRIVQRSIQTATQQDLFLRIREKRKFGQYSHNLMLEPVITGKADTSSCSGYTCINKKLDDTPLPDSIQRRLLGIVEAQRMRRRDGEYPLIKFARRLLNALSKAGGEARINRATILSYLDSKNPNQQLHYKQLLANHGLILGDWEQFIVQGKRCSLYRLTKPVAKVFELRNNKNA